MKIIAKQEKSYLIEATTKDTNKKPSNANKKQLYLKPCFFMKEYFH